MLVRQGINMKKWNRSFEKYKTISFILLIIVISLTIYILWPKEVEKTFQGIILPELLTSGFSKVEEIETTTLGDVGAVSLKADCYELTANVEASQAESIQRGLDKTYVARPNAHDIVVDAFNSLGVEVLMVKVTELKGNSFYSKLILRQGNTILSLDARPSDAIAIALRANSSIYVNSTLLREVGKKVC
jgi:bifunctional DNase/RNase